MNRTPDEHSTTGQAVPLALWERPPGDPSVGFANTYRFEAEWRARGFASRLGGEHRTKMASTLGRLGLVRRLGPERPPAYFCQMTGLELMRLWPACYQHEIVPWLWDTWSPKYDRWESFLRANRIRTAFFLARESAEYFAQRIPGLRCEWLQEALDLSGFDPSRPLRDRSIHVLELGRKFPRVHEQIREPLAARQARHLYEKVAGQVVFPKAEDMRAGLADAAIMLCFPRNMTHPHDAGGVEMLTLRYFEAMASGALPVGHCPRELRDWCGYDPVIPLPLDDPAPALLHILDHLDDYQELIARNLAWVRANGPWPARVDYLLSRLQPLGYAPQAAPK